MSGPRQTIQYTQQRLALAPARRGEPLAADRPGTEPPTAKRTTDRPAAEDQLMEEVCDRNNLEKAWKRVRRNKGGPGVDGLTIDDTATYLREHWPTIRAQLLTGTYTPQPVKRVDVPKPDGGVRRLGVPCVVDRLIQQALLQVLQGQWDPTFSEHSYGFRPGRSAHQAVAQAQAFVADGYDVVVDRSTHGGRRDHALLLTLYNTGARVSELIAVRRSHVRFGATAVVQLFGKGRKERAVPLWTRTSRCLRQWFDEEGEAASDYAFRNARGDRLTRQGVTHLLDHACRRVRERCPSLDAKRVSPHVVRHTTAMHLLQAGVDIATIALWLGHERLETTHQYVEADLQLKEDALRKLEPLGQRTQRFKADSSLLAFLASL